MEARDLMIGDWVYRIDFNTPVPVKIIGIEVVNYDKMEYVVDVLNNNKHNVHLYLNEIEPIPLTPEILEKNGWVNEHFGAQRQEWWLDKTKFPIVRYSVNDTLHHNGIVLKFVHQLQHVLKDWGIDKEIDLNNTEN